MTNDDADPIPQELLDELMNEYGDDEIIGNLAEYLAEISNTEKHALMGALVATESGYLPEYFDDMIAEAETDTVTVELAAEAIPDFVTAFAAGSVVLRGEAMIRGGGDDEHSDRIVNEAQIESTRDSIQEQIASQSIPVYIAASGGLGRLQSFMDQWLDGRKIVNMDEREAIETIVGRRGGVDMTQSQVELDDVPDEVREALDDLDFDGDGAIFTTLGELPDVVVEYLVERGDLPEGLLGADDPEDLRGFE